MTKTKKELWEEFIRELIDVDTYEFTKKLINDYLNQTIPRKKYINCEKHRQKPAPEKLEGRDNNSDLEAWQQYKYDQLKAPICIHRYHLLEEERKNLSAIAYAQSRHTRCPDGH